MAEPAFRIEQGEHELVVRVRRDAVESGRVVRFLDFLELEVIRGRSELSAEAASALAAEIDSAVWERWKSRVSE
jgi:hypothetical protein